MTPKKQTIKKSTLVPTALISGGAGFIGSHLAEALLNNKARVVVLDNYTTGKDIHINHLLSNPNFAFFNVNINEGLPSDIESVDYIFHLAGLEEYLFSKDFVNLESLFTNSLGTKNLLDLARSSSAKFLQASTIDVYQGRMSQLDINNYFGQSRFDENKFSLTEAKRFAEAVVWEYLKKFDLDVRIVRIPEVYGPRMNLEASGFLGNFLKNIIEGTDITVYGDGFEKEYYVYITDIVSGILKSLFNENTKGSIYSLVPESPVSALELAYLVRKLADGKVGIQFKPKVSEPIPQVKIPDNFNLREIDWKNRVPMREGIVRSLEWFGYTANQNNFKPAKLIQQKVDSIGRIEIPEKIDKVESISSKYSLSDVVIQPITKNDKRFIPKQKWLFKSLAIFLAAVGVFIALPLGSTVLNAKSGLDSLTKARDLIPQLESAKVVKETNGAYTSFRRAERSLAGLRWLFALTNQQERYYAIDKLLISLGDFSQGLSDLGSAGKPLEIALNSIRPDTSITLSQGSIDEASLDVSKAKNFFNLAQADFNNVKVDQLPSIISTKIPVYASVLEQSQSAVNILSALISDLPSLLGVDAQRKYIVLFQNSNEIRPTGGFIGSYGVITLDKGKLKNVIIDDIYNPDGQIDLRGISVAPPKQVTDYLGEKNLHLRNSNWSPDFTQAATAFDNLYFKVTGEKIDGYIALDLGFVKSLLKVTGPIFLAAYNETITPDNLYERTQFHSDFNYQNGSDQKKSFLTVLGEKLIEKLFSLPKDKYEALFTELGSSLEKRDVMAYLTSNQFNTVLKENNWDGGLVQTADDYLYVVNANLGGTKANYYVKNKMLYEINSLTRDGLLRATLTLDYSHTEKDNAWPGGPYKDYVRVLTQNGSKLTGLIMSVGSQPAVDLFKEAVVSKEGLYNSFATGFTLNPGHQVKLVFSYDLPSRLSLTKDRTSYQLLWQKQPGTGGDEYDFSFNPPFGMTLVNESLAKSTGILEHDLNFSVNLR